MVCFDQFARWKKGGLRGCGADLGSSSDNFTIAATPATATRSVTEHVFRTGLNYHFNSPVVAKY